MALFDLAPEAFALSADSVGVPGLAAAGVGALLLYGFLRRLMTRRGDSARSYLGAGSFSLHSVLDGLGIGFAFQAGHGVGLVVASAVLAHDFSDGLNTVNVVVKNGGTRRSALIWLLADALAPVVGAALSLFWRLPPNVLGVLLAGFAGVFFYIGAVELLPESQRKGGTAMGQRLRHTAGRGISFRRDANCFLRRRYSRRLQDRGRFRPGHESEEGGRFLGMRGIRQHRARNIDRQARRIGDRSHNIDSRAFDFFAFHRDGDVGLAVLDRRAAGGGGRISFHAFIAGLFPGTRPPFFPARATGRRIVIGDGFSLQRGAEFF